jgi:hypothetical protein
LKGLRIGKAGLSMLLLFGMVAGAGCTLAAQQGSPWRPGQFKGLVTGKATRKDVFRVFGAREPKKGTRIEVYEYPGKGDFSADVIVEVSRATGVVETITEKFSPNITRTQARKKFGERYNEVQYSVAECAHEGMNALAYRDPKGPIGLIEYPQQGLVLWPNQEGFDIAAALYLAKPLPGRKPVCAKR